MLRISHSSMLFLTMAAPAVLALSACEPEVAADDKVPYDTSVTDSADTGGETGGESCEVQLTETTPNSGAVGVYHRDELLLTFNADAASAEIAILDDAGTAVAQSVAWSAGNLEATVTATLAPTTNYTLMVGICGAENEIAFQTSSIGEPLALTDEEMTGRVYEFLLSDADITDPAILEAIDDTTIAVPILLEVTVAAGQIAFMGAMGGVTEDGTLVQHPDYEPFYFPAADFSASPYFHSQSELVSITYNGAEVPMHNFELFGTFLADGSAVVEAEVVALIDTSNIGPLLGQSDDPDAACDFTASLGLYCEACPDGEERCLNLAGENITLDYYEGMDLVE